MPKEKKLKNLLKARKDRKAGFWGGLWMREQLARMTQLNQGLISMSVGK